jgi:hypothetical protein
MSRSLIGVNIACAPITRRMPPISTRVAVAVVSRITQSPKIAWSIRTLLSAFVRIYGDRSLTPYEARP